MAMLDSEIEELKENRICARCIDDPFLSDLVDNNGEEDECSYCEEIEPSISLKELATRVEAAFDSHYSRTSSEPNSMEYMMLKDKELDYEWDRDGEKTAWAIMNAAGIPEEAADDVQAILEDEHYDIEEAQMGEEGKFSSEAHYEEIMPGDEEWQESWQEFEKTIKSEARFFSRTAAAQLSALFDTIDEMRTIDGKLLVVNAGPETNYAFLYRARYFQSNEALKPAMIRPDKELGAPPPHIAASGRMNAKGISVFYGATSVETTLAEIRPPVGCQVAVAKFDIIRPLKLLDLTALANVHEKGSIFDPEYAYRLGRMMFLSKLSNRITRPVMPDDQESEYLPTQAIADFLATEGKVPLDGIIYPSVQVNGDGLNIVLFQKAARCKLLEFPDGTDLSADTYTMYAEGPEPEYTVYERVPEPTKSESSGDQDSDMFDISMIELADLEIDDDDYGYDSREETLTVDPNSVQIHVVDAVKICTSDFKVTLHRWSKIEPDF